jgi:PKD repeat protein
VHQASTFINPLNGYTYPEGIGYRIMTTFTDTRGTDALYAGVGFGFGRILIVKSLDGVTWVPVNTSSIPSRDTRAMTTHNGKLYVGTADGLYASGTPSPYADTWEKVADFQVASLRSFNGYLYAGTGNPNGPSETEGFEVWRSTVASPSGPGDWTRVVSGGAGDAWNVLAASMQDYKGDLYVGSMNLPFATGTEGIKGFDLIRLNTGDSWDLIVGNYNPKIPTVPRGPPLSGWPSGYANPFNLYAWSIGEYNGDLYLGTFDIFSFARFIGDIPGGSDMLLAAVTSQESVDPANLPEGAGAYISGLGELEQMDPGYSNGSYIIPLLEHLGREFGGADLWTSPDGVHWVPLELNGFGDPNNYGFRTMLTTPDGFIIGTANPFTGCQVWRRSSPENPPASITSLHNTTYQQDSITWNWTDPGSANFDHVMVYLNGRFRENLPKGVQTYNASLLTPDTEYTIATRTVGTTGLVNQTWVCSTARTAPVIVITPVANFTATPDHGFVPLTVTFTDTSVTTGISSWNWNFGDGVSSALQNPPPNLYSSVQNYTVNLTVTDIRGTNTTTKTIVATNRPVSNFTATPTTGNIPLQVNFTDLSTYATGWSWDFGDGKNSTEKNPGHIYTAPGVYSVSLIAENAGGSGIPLEKFGYITVAPVASFNAAPTQGYVPLTVQFTDTSMGAPTSWSWDFGDYNTSSQQNPSHTYAAQGVYTVRLEVMKAGVTNTSEKQNLINATQPKPVAGFSGYPYNGTAKETVFHFVDLSTNNPTSWHWNFGDGTTSDIQNPTHIYNTIGNKYVSLTASNAGGSDTAYGAGPIVVKNPPPVASFTGTPTLGSVPLKVQFTDTSSNTPTNWIWIFGDGEFDLINRNPVHTYNKAGSYNVTLTVWDETSGLPSSSITKRAYITATNTPLAAFTANPVAGAAPLVVRFTDQSQGKPFRIYWTFGDGAYSYLKDPTHTYRRPGSYTVTETVQNIAGFNTVVRQNLINVTTLPMRVSS